jgi:TolB-like protein
MRKHDGRSGLDVGDGAKVGGDDSDIRPVTPGVRLRLLGPLTLFCGDGADAVTLGGRGFHFGLLAMLALQPGMEMSRDKLLLAIWGEAEPEQARQNLRQALSRLRRDLAVLPVSILQVSASAVRLDPACVSCDAVDLQAVSEGQPIEQQDRLVQQLGGDFLDGFGRSSELFEAWIRRERDRFRGLASRLLLGHGRKALDEGWHARALVFAERAHGLDPLDEGAHRLLIAALARCQGRSAALHEAGRLAALLRRELDCEPEPETNELVRRLTSGAHEVPKPVSAASIAQPPTIAIASFSPLAGSAEFGFIADGLTESIAAQLSRLRWLNVVARQPTGGEVGRDSDATALAEAFGARYLLRGSILVAMPRVRVTVQLSEARSRSLIWSERYDREASHLLDLLDDITEHVVANIEPGLYDHETFRVAHNAPAPLDGWGKIALAVGHVHSLDRARTTEAIDLLDGVVQREPENARAYAVRGLARYWMQHFGWVDDRPAALEAARRDAETAHALSRDEAWAHMVLGFVLSYYRKHEEAVVRLRTALDLNASFSLARLFLGWSLIRAGDNPAALRETWHAYRLRPRGPVNAMFAATHGLALLAAGRFEDALPFMRDSLAEHPGYMGYQTALISCCGHLGLLEEAARLREARFRVLGRHLTVAGAEAELRGFAHAPIFLDGLRLAGCPAELTQPVVGPAPWMPPSGP